MDPVLIGYCAKLVVERPEQLAAENIEEICSVSNCISSEPEGYSDYSAKRNAMWLFPTERAAAESVQPPEDREEFDIFAYKLVPVAFGDEGEQLDLDEDGEKPAFANACSTAEPLPADFELLGYDCPNKATDWPFSGFDCSPLSCNYMANEIPVNAFCLIDDLETALATASNFGKRQPEPGCYYVVEVWRKSRGDLDD